MKGYFPRGIEDTLARAVAQFPAVVVTGPRQSGKTCLLQNCFGHSHAYVALDDPLVRQFARADPRGFLEDHPPPVILDEIQHAPELLIQIKTAIDADRHSYGRFLISGSQSFSMMKGVSESLAGRTAVLDLLPLALSENPETRVPRVTSREEYARWVLAGSYPELHHRPKLDGPTWYSAYIRTYLERDVRDLASIGNILDFERLLALAAARTGSLLNYSSLAREIGVTVNTVRSWVSILQASGMILLCPAYYRSLGKRLIKSPKLYLMDPGLICRLALVETPEQVLRGPLAGALFEGLIAGELTKLITREGTHAPLYHWRTVTGQEVDFVFQLQGKIHAVECKLSSSPSPEDSRGLHRFLKALPEEIRGTGLILCTARQSVRHGVVRVVPLSAFSKAGRLEELIEG